jgi:hypothetical protein
MSQKELDLIWEESLNQRRYRKIEHTLRDAENQMRSMYPNFNSIPNAERFIISCLKANEALRQLQNGNTETVHKYWGEEE